MELKIAKILNQHLKEKRLTLRAISRGSGVATSTLSEWLNGRKPSDPTQVKRVADFLGISLHFLLFGESDKNENLDISKALKQDILNGTFEINIKRVSK